jgi:hypothetical protein
MSFDAAQWEILASGCGSKIVVIQDDLGFAEIS